ncbi:glutathione S-transferase family protein [Aurantiacibacter spongiae]|uniref:Glutathione S-transferase n=1 Tax=Aurantiacibacter spongiae TaxID=2488860 RepID=A0A3N5DC13_9SPHN|nr:glutathione S-transferase N-terminal domain-containing protein [Aurantiacibacter spongiae]RPF72318.1 glutathione S-transferase [Aurantiacibacter spongiae]
MAKYTFFHNPMSRAQIASWAFHEAGVEPEIIHVEWEDKPAALLEANPMGKLPTIVHHHSDHDHVVTETAAVCHYLAEMEAPDLLPRAEEKAAYFRWLFFAAGPMEAAVTNRAMGWDVPPERTMMMGYGDYDRTIDALDDWLTAHPHVCGERFTMADVYVGSQVGWGLRFETIPQRDSFAAYERRLAERPAYRASMDGAQD